MHLHETNDFKNIVNDSVFYSQLQDKGKIVNIYQSHRNYFYVIGDKSVLNQSLLKKELKFYSDINDLIEQVVNSNNITNKSNKKIEIEF